jgi:mRNA interferase MazF
VGDLAAAGLSAASKVRFKLFTLDHRLVRGELGRLSATDQQVVRAGLTQLFGADGDSLSESAAVQ